MAPCGADVSGAAAFRAAGMAAMALAAISINAMPSLAGERCPERIGLGFGETIADVARRCGVSVESIERSNPGLDRDKPQLGVSVNVPPPPLPSPATGGRRIIFVPVPTPPGALGR